MFLSKYISNFVFLSVSIRPWCANCVPQCKAVPDSSGWPAEAEWNTLNQSVSGRLIAPEPAGAVCRPGRPEFNNQTCALLTQQWTNESFHAMQPASVDYNDDTCSLLFPKTPCSAAGYPAYVIAAETARDVQEGVKFAAKTGVRLIVKGTGHDIPSRSSGRGSLSIWTHNIRGINVDLSQGKNRTGPTAKIAAGMRVQEILVAAAAKNVTIVTGADPGVGIGGWTTGGGHGPLTSLFGMGADQVLSMEVVTADGSLLEIDQYQHADLFWAMRGGGGSTFAVILSVTVRVHPPLGLSVYLSSYNTTGDSETYWDLITLFHTYIPSISESGGMGYYYVTPFVGTEPDAGKRGQLQVVFLFPKKSPTEAKQLMAPFETAITHSQLKDKVYSGGGAIFAPSFSEDWQQNPPEAVGVDVRIGSRLLDKEALTSNKSALNAALRAASPQPWTIIGHVVAGPGPRNVSIPGGSNAVLPAWRKAYAHVVTTASWANGNSTQENLVLDNLREVREQALKDLAPNMGAYMNEGDPSDPQWQETFYGGNYPRLLELKKKWDAQGVFWCKPCVGNELWTVSGGDAIGQHEGTICRK